MMQTRLDETPRNQQVVRSETLARLHWLSIIGQLIAVITTQFFFQYELPLPSCLMVIVTSIIMNLFLQLPEGLWLNERAATWILIFDSVQFSLMIYLTGGMANPFAMMGLAPVMVAANILSAHNSILISSLVILFSTILLKYNYPLPWNPDKPIHLPFLYIVGQWTAIVLTVVFVGFFAWRVAQERRQLARALAATELLLSHEHHLSQLDGLAAAAAHELGTPLGTIALIAKELSKTAPQDSEIAEDLQTLREQVERCRGILFKLSAYQGEEEEFFGNVTLHQLMTEIREKQIADDLEIRILAKGEGDEPVLRRNPGLTYGLNNLIENALDFAEKRIDISISWNSSQIKMHIQDDGPGFPADVLSRIGKPYLAQKKREPIGRERKSGGLGLGLFISKTLIERTGAQISFMNAPSPKTGAKILILWQRNAFG